MPPVSADSFDLARFVRAQADDYDRALAELRAGQKRTHWVWYIFPQVRGLGHSANADFYGIGSIDEARAYLAHPLLGQRLRECVTALLSLPGRDPVRALGNLDALKVRSSLTLFREAEGSGLVFERALDDLYAGEPCPRTLELLGRTRRGAVEVLPLSPDRLGDFLAFFDRDAFADNPDWGGCFCQYLYVDHHKADWEARTGAQNRAAACERICARTMQGYLAYRDGKPVGWCNAAPRVLLDALAAEPDPDAAKIGHIGCFVIARAHRRAGVATALLAAACDGLRAQGLEIAEAMPATDAKSDAQHYHGPLRMFLHAGFAVHRTLEDGRVVVRKRLVPAWLADQA